MVTWIGFWFNIPGVTLDPTEVANDLFNGGVDVLLSGIDTTEAIVVAGQRADQGQTVWAIPYDYEGACDIKPEICLGTPYFNWAPYYIRTIKAVKAEKDGVLDQTWVWEAPDWKKFDDNTVTPVGFQFGPALTDADKANLEDYIARLASGETQGLCWAAESPGWHALSRRGRSGHPGSDLVSAAAAGRHGRRQQLAR